MCVRVQLCSSGIKGIEKQTNVLMKAIFLGGKGVGGGSDRERAICPPPRPHK